MSETFSPEQEFAANEKFLECVRKSVINQCLVALAEGADHTDVEAFDGAVIDGVIRLSPPSEDPFIEKFLRMLAQMEMVGLRGNPGFHAQLNRARSMIAEWTPEARQQFLFVYGGKGGAA